MNIKSEKIKKFLKYSIPAKIFIVAFFLFFVFQLVVHVYPFLFVINNSLKTAEEIYQDSMAITTTWSFRNYLVMIQKFQVRGGIYFEELLFNSIWETALWLLANISSSVLVAYVLAKYRFPGHGLVYGIMIFTQTIPILGTGAAAYKLLHGLRMINNPASIWFYWCNGFDYSAFILYGTFKGVSKSYSESAKLDGASNVKIFFSIMLPMMFPCIIALLVTNFLTMWNNYTTSQVSLSKFPNLAYGIYIFQKDALYMEEGDTIFYTALVASSIPGLALYLSMQNLIVKNLSVGGLKG